jgi:hypothetical protein
MVELRHRQEGLIDVRRGRDSGVCRGIVPFRVTQSNGYPQQYSVKASQRVAFQHFEKVGMARSRWRRSRVAAYRFANPLA